MLSKERFCWQVRTLTGHPGKRLHVFSSNIVESVYFSSDGTWVISWSSNIFIKIWDAETGAEVSCGSACRVDRNLRCILLKMDSSCTACECVDPTDMKRAPCRQIFSCGGHNGEGLCICTVNEQGYVELDADDKPILHPACTVTGHGHMVTRVELSNDGAQVISGSDDGTVTSPCTS